MLSQLVCRMALAAACCFASQACCAQEYVLGALRISGLWALATPPSATVAGGFMTIINSGASADRLVSVTTNASGHVDIHEMHIVNGVMMMRTVNPGITIQPKATATLKPFSHHLMLEDLKRPLKAGETVTATLVFEKAGSIEVILNVEPLGSNGPKTRSGDGTILSKSREPLPQHKH
jgi:periplasmic copper chaperone A